MRLLITVLLTSIASRCAFSQDYIITTLAGNGIRMTGRFGGFSGDNGPAIKAQLDSPKGIAVDSAGSVYFADAGNGRIRKVSNGVITTVAGNGSGDNTGDNGPALNSGLGNMHGLAADSTGNLYLADVGSLASDTIFILPGSQVI